MVNELLKSGYKCTTHLESLVNVTSNIAVIVVLSSDKVDLLHIDLNTDKCLLFSSYHYVVDDKFDIYNDLIFKKILKNKYSRLIVYIQNQSYTIVPTVFYSEKDAYHYLKYLAPIALDDVILSNETINFGTNIVFNVKSKLDAYINNISSKVTIVHQATVILEWVGDYHLLNNLNYDKPYIYIYINKAFMYITVIKGQNLFYHNSFIVKNVQEFVKYLSSFMYSLELNSKHNFVFMGDITDNYDYYKESVKYLKNVVIESKYSSQSKVDGNHIIDSLIYRKYVDVFKAYEYCFK